MPEVRVLFLGIGNPVPPFIQNRILQLDKTGRIEAIVLVPRESSREFPLENGLTFPQLQVCFNLRHTIIPLIWYSLRFPSSTVRLWSSLFVYSIRARIRSFIKYHSLVRVKGINVVHFQWIVSPEEIYWARRFFKVSVVISARGSQLTIYPATEPGYEDQVRESLRAANHIYTVSKSMAQACIEFGAEPGKIFVSYNGINAGQYRNISKQETHGALRLVSTGTLMWRKGYFWQLILIRNLTEAGLDVKLEIVGDGPDHQGLEYTINRLGLQDRVILAGRKNHDDILKYLQASDIYICSSAAEGLSNSVLEAVASGLPVVAFDCEGMNEVIESGHNGFIVPFGDLESMGEKIQSLYDDRKMMLSMGYKGSQLAYERFNYKPHIQKMLDFYKSISTGNE